MRILTLAVGAMLGALAVPVAPALGAGATPAKAKPRQVVDWSKTVVATPQGGFRMGNPQAKLKLVEYGSLTCGHCAHFARDGMPTLIAGYVKSGKASYEYRNYVLNGIDVTATLLARCTGPRGFFPMTDALYAQQDVWVSKISGLPAAEKERLKALPEGERLLQLAKAGGLTTIAARFGVTPARAQACLGTAPLEKLGTMVEAANALGVQGTPTFFINGQNVGSHTWASLEPLLRQSGPG